MRCGFEPAKPTATRSRQSRLQSQPATAPGLRSKRTLSGWGNANGGTFMSGGEAGYAEQDEISKGSVRFFVRSRADWKAHDLRAGPLTLWRIMRRFCVDPLFRDTGDRKS